jgi:hypothetical protein
MGSTSSKILTTYANRCLNYLANILQNMGLNEKMYTKNELAPHNKYLVNSPQRMGPNENVHIKIELTFHN